VDKQGTPLVYFSGDHSFMQRIIVLSMAVALPVNVATADTLETVRQRGFLRCGITEANPGFSSVDSNGDRIGFDIDQCKTIAVAIFGEAKIEYIPLTPTTAFLNVQSGGVDMFAGGATWTYTRDSSLGLDFTGVYYIGGQGFLTRRENGVKEIADLDGATICIPQGTTTEQNVADYFSERSLRYTALNFSDFNQAILAYRMGRCDAITENRAGLAIRAKSFDDSEQHVVLVDQISQEPQSAIVRQGDDRWRDILFWSFNARIAAEELGINQANVEKMRKESGNVEVQRLLGVVDNFGEKLDLSNDWAFNIIKQVGSYKDMWERNFSAFDLERGINSLWTEGGAMYALPFR
jgi:general L-amino acid transport system substrate-binding protein